MSKYINADKLCEDLMNRWEIADKEKEKEIQSIMADVVAPIVAGQPAADVVEIVRCKNCKFFEPVSEYSGNCYRNEINNIFDGYCNKAERRESE